MITNQSTAKRFPVCHRSRENCRHPIICWNSWKKFYGLIDIKLQWLSDSDSVNIDRAKHKLNFFITQVIYIAFLNKHVYTYLAVLASSDLVICVLLLFSSLARSVFRCYKGWLEFDAFVYFPIGSVTSNITVWAALGVSVDRLISVCR